MKSRETDVLVERVLNSWTLLSNVTFSVSAKFSIFSAKIISNVEIGEKKNNQNYCPLSYFYALIWISTFQKKLVLQTLDIFIMHYNGGRELFANSRFHCRIIGIASGTDL